MTHDSSYAYESIDLKLIIDPCDGLCGNIFTTAKLKAMANEFLRFSQLLNLKSYPDCLIQEDLISFAQDCDAYAMQIKSYRNENENLADFYDQLLDELQGCYVEQLENK